jgi:hypothetical protein
MRFTDWPGFGTVRLAWFGSALMTLDLHTCGFQDDVRLVLHAVFPVNLLVALLGFAPARLRRPRRAYLYVSEGDATSRSARPVAGDFLRLISPVFCPTCSSAESHRFGALRERRRSRVFPPNDLNTLRPALRLGPQKCLQRRRVAARRG